VDEQVVLEFPVINNINHQKWATYYLGTESHMHDSINPTTSLYDPVMNIHESVLTFSVIVKFLLWKTIKLVSLSTRNSIAT